MGTGYPLTQLRAGSCRLTLCQASGAITGLRCQGKELLVPAAEAFTLRLLASNGDGIDIASTEFAEP